VGVVALAIALTLLMGLCIGLLHALMINSFRLPPFIATLATMAGFRSLAAILSGNRTITLKFDVFRVLGNNAMVTLAIFACVAAALSIMMGTTVLGRHLFALGGNETAARLSGLPTRRLKAVAYALSGMLAALGGVLFAGRGGAADPRLGIGYELIAITAAVVGGCSLSGGVGSVRGTVLGLILIQIVIKATGQLAPQGIDSTQVEGLVLGTVVVLAVAFNQRFRGRG
jgi:ribose/xylose/arabinose/galactoside ABC-type transport system permease subunit